MPKLLQAEAVTKITAGTRGYAAWRDGGTAGRDREAPVRLGELTSLLDSLLGNRFDRAAATVLLLVGVVAGALGWFLAL